MANTATRSPGSRAKNTGGGKATTSRGRGGGTDGNAKTVSSLARGVTKLTNFLQEFQQQKQPTQAMEAWLKGNIPIVEALLEDCQQHQKQLA